MKTEDTTFRVYILCSESSGRLYIGYTQELSRRLAEHNSGQTKSTRSKGPWRLLHAQSVSSKTEAIELEKKLKSWKNKSRVLAWIARQEE